MSNPRKRLLQRSTGRREEDGDSSPVRHFSPPSSPARSSSSGEIIVDFPNDSFDSTFSRKCACADLFCNHRYRGTLDDTQLMQFLDMTKKQSLEVPIERQPSFFESPDTLHIGNVVSIRKAVDPIDGFMKVYIRRDNGVAHKPSIIKFHASELKDFLRTTLVPLYIKTCQLTPQQLFKSTITHNHGDPAFWMDGLTMTNMSMDIKVRPFLLAENRLAFRFYQMLGTNIEMRDENSRVFKWGGPCMTLLAHQYLALIHKLGELKEEY